MTALGNPGGPSAGSKKLKKTLQEREREKREITQFERSDGE